MPATFQKTIDKPLEGRKNCFAFLDEILIATKCKLKEHEDAVDTILNKLDWLRFKTTPNGVTPRISKTEALQI